MVRAIEVAREAGRKVAFTLSDMFCVDRHRDGFNAAARRRPDRHPVRQPGGDRGAGRSAAPRERGRGGEGQGGDIGRDPQRGRRAGDARRRARRRAGRADRRSWSTRPARATCSRPASCSATRAARASSSSLRLGAIAAAEVIQHYGARPEADLRALAGGCSPSRAPRAARRGRARQRRHADRGRSIGSELRHLDDPAADMAAAARIAEVDDQADRAPHGSTSIASSGRFRYSPMHPTIASGAMTDCRRAERAAAARVPPAQDQHRERDHREREKVPEFE